jgi:hypothetical protein
MQITSCKQENTLTMPLDDQADDKDKQFRKLFASFSSQRSWLQEVLVPELGYQAQLPPPHPDLRARSEQSAKLEQLAKSEQSARRWWRSNWRRKLEKVLAVDEEHLAKYKWAWPICRTCLTQISLGGALH